MQRVETAVTLYPSPGASSGMHTATPCILLAEQDLRQRKIMRYSLNKYGYSVIECPSGMELLDWFGALSFPRRPENIDLVISDISLPGVTGLEILEEVGHRKGFPPFIMISSYRDRPLDRLARKFGARSVLAKPIDVDALLASVIEVIPSASPGRRPECETIWHDMPENKDTEVRK